MRQLISHGRIIDPANSYDAVGDLLIEDGVIAWCGERLPDALSQPNDIVFDASGLVVTPGLIDMHVHLREPGQEYKETLETGGMAAAAGGFTSVVPMPNTVPATDSKAMVEFVVRRAKETSAVRVWPTVAATKGNLNEQMAEIADAKSAGAVAVTDDAFPLQSAEMTRRVMEYSRTFNLPLLTHCEDKSMTKGGVMNEGYTSMVMGLKGMPKAAEDLQTMRNIELAHLSGCHVHILHVSSARSVVMIREAKKRGVRVSCETAPQYFTLTDETCLGYNTLAKCSPPLRSQADITAVQEGMADGTIDAIATDHAPHAAHEKECEFQEAVFGMIGLETALGLTITLSVNTGVISLYEAVRKLTIAPAEILQLPVGRLSVQSAADVTIFDPSGNWTVNAKDFHSKSRNTPFDGWELNGKVVATIVGGQVVYGNIGETADTRQKARH
ncbi:MAG: dihydroorotase [Armatimonadota bacterium]